MSEPLFVPGQRWVSNTESELGLGIVAEVHNRRVEMSFPASSERRTYATNNAPLSRVRYEVGQKVSDAEERPLLIEEVLERAGLLFYRGFDDQGEEWVLTELELNSFVQFSKPQDRLFAGQIDKNRAFNLRCETLNHIRHQQLSPIRGLLGARVQLLPHQLYIAHETANRHAPRVLLADEVGLGKTIEAGLIIHHQLLTGRAKRVLIVVPDSLLHQWLVEMLRRFNIYFSVFDDDRCQAAVDSGNTNPFESEQLVLCSLSTLTNYPQWFEQAKAAHWDLLVVDEAHHLAWSEQAPSLAYQCIEALGKAAAGLLLLTATPEQLGKASHFSRLRLLDPDRYYDLEGFIKEEQGYQELNELLDRLQVIEDQESLLGDGQLLAELELRLGLGVLDNLHATMNEQGLSIAVHRCIRELLDQQGTGRVLFRNTRASVQGFPNRVMNLVELETPADYPVDTSAYNLQQLLHPEQLLGDGWLECDSRVSWLVQWLKAHRQEKVLLICASADTALDLELHLRLREGVHSAVFHEGLSLVARDRAAAYFADNEEGAQLLVCSEIGSEGRNFQFSHHLVLFDLPLNPDLLEQRIGRLDRIGQRQDVHIHVPVYKNTAQLWLLQWYHQGLNAFEKTCPAGNALYKQLEKELLACLTLQGQGLLDLIAKTKAHYEELLEALHNGRDKLLELNSFDEEKAAELVKGFINEERRQELADYMERVFNLFGVDQEQHSAVSTVLHPSDHMICHQFPGLPEEGLTATYSRDIALSREDMHFLTWEHPMVTGAMDMILGGEYGNTAFATIKLPPLKPGTLLLETVYTLYCPAPAELQLQRYLPLTSIRVVIDANENDLSKVLSAERLQPLLSNVPRRVAQDLVQQARADISDLLDKSRILAEDRQQQILSEAATKMRDEQQQALQRLESLAARNPNIREEEIAYLKHVAEISEESMGQSQCRLDALRVLVVIE